MMNLKLVTWDGDFTQFLVEAETEDEAIEKSIKANWKYGDPGGDDCGLVARDIDDPTTYTVEDVDFSLLSEIFRREDCYGRLKDAIVFND